MTNKYNHVAVLMGGWSTEREVSLRSGAACAGAGCEGAAPTDTALGAGPCCDGMYAIVCDFCFFESGAATVGAAEAVFAAMGK